MRRLIDANVVEKVMNERYKALAAEYGHYDHYTTGYGDALGVVEDAPTIDSVEVVRCKDCVHWCYTMDGSGECTNRRFHLDGCADPSMDADDFCSCGERKELG